MKNIKLKFAALVAIAAVSATTAHAGQGRGGGDAVAARMRVIVGWLAPGNVAKIISDLNTIVTNVTKIAPSGQISAEITELTKKGIASDFDPSLYDTEATCVDKKGVEHSMTTETVDLAANPNQARPKICINVRLLAEEDADYKMFVANLFHEHARHYNDEDTDRLGMNPMVDFITEKYEWLMRSVVLASADTISFDGLMILPPQARIYAGWGLGENLSPYSPSYKAYGTPDGPVTLDEEWIDENAPNASSLEVYSSPELENYNLSVVVDTVEGKCEKAYAFFSDMYGAVKNKLGSVAAGAKFDLHSLPGTSVVPGTFFAFYIDETTYQKAADGDALWLSMVMPHRDNVCNVTYHLVFNGASSPNFAAAVHSDFQVRGSRRPSKILGQIPATKLWRQGQIRFETLTELKDLQ